VVPAAIPPIAGFESRKCSETVVVDAEAAGVVAVEWSTGSLDAPRRKLAVPLSTVGFEAVAMCVVLSCSTEDETASVLGTAVGVVDVSSAAVVVK
jgi:hypothetical protein